MRFDLNLIDPGHLVFDRVFDRENFDVGLIEFIKRGVERGRLTATGRAGHEQNAVRLRQRFFELRKDVRRETELFKVQLHAALVENTHHDALAVHRGHGGDAKVDVFALQAQPNAAVLRQAALGDVKVRHDFDARNHGGGEALGRRFDFVQHAIDAVANDEAILERLDVNVGGATVKRVGDDEAHEPNHWRFGS